jgi:hypothetical protein
MKEITEQLILGLFPELTEIEIKTFEELNRYKLDENNEWVNDTPAYFVGITYTGLLTSPSITDLLSDFTGCEYNIFLC